MASLLTRRTTTLLRSSPRAQTRLAGDVHYNPPTGYLFGEKPPAPGTKRVKEEWENIYYYGFFGACALGGFLKWYKPDTSIEGWARKEAEKKMAAAGETPSYVKS